MTGVVFVHPNLARKALELSIAPLFSSHEVFRAIGIELLEYQFPEVDLLLTWPLHNCELRLRVDASNYSYRPIDGWWIGEDSCPLPSGAGRVPQGNGFHTQRLNGDVRSWFCFPGWQEYHNHPSHQDISWASIRNQPQYCVSALISNLRVDLNRPNTGKV